MNKIAELQDYIDRHTPHIIKITETWCTGLVGDAELYLKRLKFVSLVVECYCTCTPPYLLLLVNP